MKIIQEILEKMIGISKPQKKFISNLLYTILSMGGRMNFRNMARYARYDEKTFFRNFGKAFDYLRFNCLAVNKIIDENGYYGIAYDPFFIKKSGNHTYGLESFWNGSSGKSEKGLEGNGFALIDIKKNTAYPLAVIQTPPKEEIKSLLTPEANRMDFYVNCAEQQLNKMKSNGLPLSIKLLIVDAYFANRKFVAMARKCGYHVVSKLRCDANLRHLDFEKKSGRGRPKKYGAKVNVKDLKNFSFVCETAEGDDLYEGTFYSINLKCLVKVACLVRTRKNKQSLVLMFSTDLSLSAQDIHTSYSSRFQIEFIFRDGKQFVGLTEFQARSKEKIHTHLNASATALLLTKIQEAEARSDTDERVPFSMQSHKRKNYNEMLVNLIFSILGLDQSLIKLVPGIKSVIETGVVRC